MYVRPTGYDQLIDAALRAFGRAFAELRRGRGFSQRALAARTGVAQSSISRLEAGKAPWLSAKWIALMLVELGAIDLRQEPTGATGERVPGRDLVEYVGLHLRRR